MLKFIGLAIKNVFRNKRRTIITALVLIFGAAALILAGGFVSRSFEGLSERTIRGQLGHIQIYNKEYFSREEEKPLEFGFNNADEIKSKIEKMQNVRFAMARVEFMGLLSNGDKSAVFVGRGIEPKQEKELAGDAIPVESGNFLTGSDAGDGVPEVMVAKGLAKNLKAKVGDVLTIMATTSKGALNAMDVHVVGTFSTGVPEYDERGIMIDLQSAQQLLVTNKVSKIVVVLDNTNVTCTMAASIQNSIPNITTKRWDELATFYKAVVNLYNGIFFFMGIIIFVVVVLSCSNTMMMSILERTKEIGTQLAVGTSRLRLLTNFLYEGLTIGIIGGGGGTLLALLIGLFLNSINIMMPPPPGATHGFPLRVNLVPGLYAGVFFLMVIMTVVSTVFPAVKASRLNIVNALGHI